MRTGKHDEMKLGGEVLVVPVSQTSSSEIGKVEEVPVASSRTAYSYHIPHQSPADEVAQRQENKQLDCMVGDPDTLGSCYMEGFVADDIAKTGTVPSQMLGDCKTAVAKAGMVDPLVDIDVDILKEQETSVYCCQM